MKSPRNCWPVLADKARDVFTQRKQDLVEALARVEQLQASRERLLRLYDDYRQREAQPVSDGAGMQHQANHRQFMAQLLTLRERVDHDIGRAQSVVAQQRARLVEAEVELRKMEALVEGEQRAFRDAQQKREQRQFDAVATAQFNARRAAAKA